MKLSLAAAALAALLGTSLMGGTASAHDYRDHGYGYSYGYGYHRDHDDRRFGRGDYRWFGYERRDRDDRRRDWDDRGRGERDGRGHDRDDRGHRHHDRDGRDW